MPRQGYPGLQMVTFILNGIPFMLIGLQLPQVIHALAPARPIEVVRLALLVLLVLVLVRFAWLFGATFCRVYSAKRFAEKTPHPGSRQP